MIKAEDFDKYWQEILAGRLTPPNYENLEGEELMRALATIACGAMLGITGVEHFLPIAAKWPEWARYFPNHTQGGKWDGTALVIRYMGGRGGVGRFELCKHEKRLRPGANPSRGWSPGDCVHCGLDMTVDSGD